MRSSGGSPPRSYRDEHIQVDFFWEWVGPRGKWLIDLFATLVLLAFMAAFAWMLTYKVESGFRSNEATFDIRMPVWPFHAIAALGIFLAVLLIVIRLVRSGAAAAPRSRTTPDPCNRGPR